MQNTIKELLYLVYPSLYKYVFRKGRLSILFGTHGKATSKAIEYYLHYRD